MKLPNARPKLSTRLPLASLPLALLCACGVRAFAQTGAPPRPVPTPEAVPAQQAPPAALPQGARVVGDAVSPQGWKRYEFQYSTGSVAGVVLPAELEATSEKIPVGDLPPATNHMFTAADDHGVYVFAYLEGLPVAVSDNPDAQTAFFKGLWSGVADGFRAELRKKGLDWSIEQQPQRETTISGRRAQAQDFSVGQFAGRAAAVIGGGHAYIVMTISLSNSLGPQSAAFLDSFALRPPPKP